MLHMMLVITYSYNTWFSSFLFRVPEGLEDVSKYPYLFAELMKSDRWSDEDIAKLAGKNLIRVFEEVEAVNVPIIST